MKHINAGLLILLLIASVSLTGCAKNKGNPADDKVTGENFVQYPENASGTQQVKDALDAYFK